MQITLYRGMIDEYDIKECNVSILADLGLISDEMYQDLTEGDKELRNITIGMLMRDQRKLGDKELVKLLDEKIKILTDKFIEMNKIPKKSVLEVAKDAVFTHNFKDAKTKEFGNYVRFRSKEQYMAYLAFPIKEGSTSFIKIYFKLGGQVVRGSRIKKDHPAYLALQKIFTAITDKNSKGYLRAIAECKRKCEKTEEPLINHVDNAWLIQVLKEINIDD